MWEAAAVNLKYLIIIEHDIGYKMCANNFSGFMIYLPHKITISKYFLNLRNRMFFNWLIGVIWL